MRLKSDEEKTVEEEWDEKLTENENKVEIWRKEKTGIGPEPRLVPSDGKESSGATMYADDSSVSETANTIEDLKVKTERMLDRVFAQMRSKRLLVNADKTRVMCFATYQKRTKNDLSKFEIDIEGVKVSDVKTARLLGVTLENNYSWDSHIKETLNDCSKRLNSLYKIKDQLDRKQRKELIEGSIVSKLRFSLEVISSCTETNMKKLESMLSKSARFILNKRRKDWSKTDGYAELCWLTTPQLAIESSLRMFYKIIWNKKPSNIFQSIYDEDRDEIREVEDTYLEKITKLQRNPGELEC